MNDLTVMTLLEPLLIKTRARQVEWLNDPTGGCVVELGRNLINIYARKEHATDFITLRLIDGQRRVVDFVDLDRTRVEFDHADELLRLATDKALRKEAVIQETLAALDHLT